MHQNPPFSMAYTRVNLLFFAFLLIQLIITSLAQSNNGMVPVGSIISANETGIPWLSPSGDFAFGFQPVQGQDLYYLCVWFRQLPDKTLAWYLGADGHDPVPKGSTVTLDAQYGLVLNGPQGNFIWKPPLISANNTDHGYMNDTGNFELISSDNIWLWQSFYNAIETILPLQGLIFGSILHSRKSYSNISQPIYYLVFQQDGDFTLSTSSDNDNKGDIYYYSNTSDPKNASNSAYVLNLNIEGYFSVTRNNSQTTDISQRTVPSSLDNYYKATVNTDGVFALSYHPRKFTISPGWTDVWTAPENICIINNGSGLCGSNSNCTLVKQRPVCQYSQVPEASPKTSPEPSAKPSPEPSPESSPEPIPKSSPEQSHEPVVCKHIKKEALISSVVVNILLFGAIASLGLYSILSRKKEKPNSSQNFPETNTRYFSYKELEEATDGFKDEAGRGSFGIVYRGMLPSGSKASIAVKKLDRVALDAEKEFRAEVNTIGQTHHKNLVELLGFCDEKQHRLLVYEYMTNGTLASFIFKKPKPSWNLRTQIAIGISRAIAYLHEDCNTQIIHCDIKPQNILLDENYNARISDFGLAKLLVINQSKTITNIRGTKGYVAPEWFRNTPVTAKVDVYSFGVMLLELVCCKRNIEELGMGEEDNSIILVDWVWDCFQVNKFDILVEGDIEALADWETMERFVKVGIWCVQEDANIRPTMRKVSLMLEGIVDVCSPPCPDPFSSAP